MREDLQVRVGPHLGTEKNIRNIIIKKMWLGEQFPIRPSLEWMSFGNKIPDLIS